jgi:hypothetical protein
MSVSRFTALFLQRIESVWGAFRIPKGIIISIQSGRKDWKSKKGILLLGRAFDFHLRIAVLNPGLNALGVIVLGIVDQQADRLCLHLLGRIPKLGTKRRCQQRVLQIA